ncbi:hypothetical protein BGZ93_008742 [Podila epicladia]|nr:hypothetical protein BGZ92_009124 [Podila epicladia]KAG0091649.1 hypothetical protein BGZ93_008742 [Podila epicladia]
MKILSIFLGLAAAAMTTVAEAVQDQVKVTPEQVAAFDPMAPLDVNVYYAWATTGTEAEIAAKAEKMADSLSEVQFRSRLLARLETDIAAPSKFLSDDVSPACNDFLRKLKAGHKSLIDLLATLDTQVPVIGAFIKSAAEMAKKFLDLVDMAIDDASKVLGAGIDSSLAALESTLVALGAETGLSDLLHPLASAIGAVRQVTKTIERCLGGVFAMSIDASYCYGVADLYRCMAQDVQNYTPALSTSSSEELKRLAAGASIVLNLIAQNSIAAKNEDLFSAQSIFAVDVMDDYRFELQRVAEEEKNEEWKLYAQLGLGAVCGVSNALEACVRVVSNPRVARKELEEDLAFEEEMNEYEDEDAE